MADEEARESRLATIAKHTKENDIDFMELIREFPTIYKENGMSQVSQPKYAKRKETESGLKNKTEFRSRLQPTPVQTRKSFATSKSPAE